MNNIILSNSSSLTAGSLIIATSQTMRRVSSWQEVPVSGLAACEVVTEEKVYDSEIYDDKRVVVSFAKGMNPCTGCQYSANDPFCDTTVFVPMADGSCQEIILYSSDSKIIGDISQTSNLSGDEVGVAFVASELARSEFSFCILVQTNEVNLINYCKEKGWRYEIVGS